MSEQTTVVLADDHPGILASVSKYLGREGLDVVGRAKDGHGAVNQIQQKQPAIALLDIRMPGLSGIEVTRWAARRAPQTAVILFTGYGSRAQLVEAFDAGARGILMKNAALPEVLRAIQVVSRGGMYFDAVLASVEVPTLTQRDRDVLRLLANGDLYEEIGHTLFISKSTVRKIMSKVKTKLGVATTTQAVAVALRDSLIA
jgi:DNA-binding NarL/FixJ family response regulator